jgi:hypothetical protein
MIRMSPAAFAKLDGSLEGVRQGLQTAIRLEHSTIPPYLQALYSLKPDALTAERNAYVYGVLRSVVLEEMFHMVSACNILNAIGGAPVIDDPAFLPVYPGHLPGTVEDDLIVGLKRFSIDVVRDTFMVIEEPESPLHIPDQLAAAARPLTIGTFYQRIADQLTALGDSVFTGDPRRQVLHPLIPDTLNEVIDVKSARQAIALIVEQGEGTATSPLDPGDEPAHYYRFAEIVHGKRLIPVANPKPGDPPFAYGGAPIPFDPAGVWPVIDNPTSASYPAKSSARAASDQFNYTYTALLKALDRTVNGEPHRLADAVGLMESLRAQAMDLMAMPLDGQRNAGPTFEYLALIS